MDLPSQLLAHVASQLSLDLGRFLAARGIGLAAHQFGEPVSQLADLFLGQAFEAFDHAGFDAGAGKGHAVDVGQELPAQRDLNRRALPATGRVRVADPRRVFLRGVRWKKRSARSPARVPACVEIGSYDPPGVNSGDFGMAETKSTLIFRH